MMKTPFHSLIDRLSEYWKFDSLSGIRCYIYITQRIEFPLPSTPQVAPLKAQLLLGRENTYHQCLASTRQDRFRGPLFISIFLSWEELLWKGGKVREPKGGRTCGSREARAHKSRLGHDYG